MLDDSLTAGHLEPTSLPDSSSSSTIADSNANAKTRGAERDEQRTLEVNERFAGFVIRGHLGRGAMGVVYEAWDPTLERRVALKLLRSPSKRAAERLLREARALARLDHPNVVRIYAADVHRGAVYIAMELVEGQNLREWLGLERDWTEIMPVMLGAARGLAAAHAARVIHRDLKPENILVGWDGQARVLDFGIARISTQHPDHLTSTVDGGHSTDGEAESHCGSAPLSGSFAGLPEDGPPDGPEPEPDGEALTEAGALIGTLLYMAPEQHARERADERSDQFAFCTTLFEAIYGAHPFPATSRTQLELLVSEGKVRFPNDDHSRAPRWLERVILEGLSPDREKRFATMDHLIDALERHPRRRRARNRALVFTAVLAGAVTFGFAVVPRAEHQQPCADVSDEIDAKLGPSARQEISDRFAAIDQPWAGEMGKRVNAELEAWSARWIASRTNVCIDRHEHREATVIDERREACLADQLASAAALGEVLTEAQQRVLTNAERALTRLPDPSVCEGDDPPIGHTAVPVEHDALVAEFFELEWLALTGGDSRTLARARALVEAIRALPDSEVNRSLLGDALVTLGEAEMIDGNLAVAEATLHEAIRVAERSGADGVRAQAVVNLGWVLTQTPGRAGEAQRLLEDAAALLERVGSPMFESIRRRQSLGEALLANGEPERAREMFESALAEAGDRAPANVHFTTSLGLSRVADMQNDHAGALELAQAALATLEPLGSGESPLLAFALTNIGHSLIHLGRFEEARAAIDRSIVIRRASVAADASVGNRRLLGESLMNLAHLESVLGNPETAADINREILALLHPDDHVNRSLVLLNLGVDHQVAGRHHQAYASYEESLRLAERVLALDSKQVVGARLGMGSMLVALDRPAEARIPLERCVADWPESLEGTFDEAELDFALARSLVALDGWSVRADNLASSAAALYNQLGDAAQAEAIDAWRTANAE